MKQIRISEWPTVRVSLHLATLEHIEAKADERALSVSALIREALDRVYRSQAR